MKNIISETTHFHPFILKKAQIFGGEPRTPLGAMSPDPLTPSFTLGIKYHL